MFVGLFALYLLLILFPILLAHRYYNDDLVRTLLGNYGWSNNGRHLANLLMRVLQFGAARLVDIAPLPQIGAIAVLAWTGVLIARRFCIQSPLLAILVALPLGAQPFYLENLSYRYDAFGMALALLLALVPVLVIARDRRGWWLGTLSLMASLSFYQPALTAFLIFCLVECAVAQSRQATPAQLLRGLSSRALQVLLVLLVYRIAITPSLKAWTLEHNDAFQSLEQLPLLWSNAMAFWEFVIHGFPPRWTQLFVPFAVLAATVPLVCAAHYAMAGRQQRSGWQTATLLLTAVLGPLLALGFVAGPMLLLTSPVIVPRVMNGVGALLSGALVVMYAAGRRWPASLRWQLGNAGFWALGMVVSASIYGNALSAQQRYEDRIATSLANDIASLRNSAPVRYYLLDGSAGDSVETARVVAQFPLIDSLVPRYLGEYAINQKFFLGYYQLGADDLRLAFPADARIDEAMTTLCDLPPLQRRPAYELRRLGEVAVVSFNDGRATACPRPSTSAGRLPGE